jgi:hypothetical protein
MAVAHFLVKAAARSPAVYMLAMLPYVLGSGTYRSAAVNAQLMQYALAAGMKEGPPSRWRRGHYHAPTPPPCVCIH